MKTGEKIIGIWGAGLPEWEGMIAKIAEYPQGTEVDVLWENGSTTYAMLTDLRDDYWNPEGSAIGLYYGV